MRVFQAISDELHARGVRAAFTLMSEDVAELVVDLARVGITAYSVRDESAAVGMAHGYAQGSGGIGVAIVGRGPALTNTLTHLVNAAKERVGVGLLVLAGDTALRDKATVPPGGGQLKFIDQGRMLESVDVPQVTVGSADAAIADVRLACDVAASGGVVVVNIPMDILPAVAGATPSSVSLAAPVRPPEPDQGTVETIVDLMTDPVLSRHMIVLAGRGAALSHAGPALRALAERTGAVLATTLLARSLFAGEPFDTGIMGTASTPVSRRVGNEATLVVAVGASLHGTQTWKGTGFPNARIVQVDRDPAAFGRYQPAEVTLHADALEAATALLAEVERRGVSATGSRSRELAEELADSRRPRPFEDPGPGRPMHPAMAMRAIDAALPARRSVVIETGHCLSFVGRISAHDADSFHFPHGFGAIGASLAYALGHALARPERLTVWAGGDGSLMMQLPELDTAVRYGIRIACVICDDGGFGAEVHMLDINGLDGSAARYANPSFEAVAKAMGAEGVTVRGLDDIAVVAERVSAATGPVVIDCLVDPTVRAGWVDFFYGRPSSAHATVSAGAASLERPGEPPRP